jgi:hypothetical protein
MDDGTLYTIILAVFLIGGLIHFLRPVTWRDGEGSLSDEEAEPRRHWFWWV